MLLGVCFFVTSTPTQFIGLYNSMDRPADARNLKKQLPPPEERGNKQTF